jgi:hypothetical protein
LTPIQYPIIEIDKYEHEGSKKEQGYGDGAETD